MKRTVAASIFCLLHLAFIIMPEVQIWPYLNAIAGHHKLVEVTTVECKESPRVGDIMYLTAIIERAKTTSDTKEKNTIPEITVSHTGLFYLLTRETDNHLLCTGKVEYIMELPQQPLLGVKEDSSPPPKFTSS